MHLLHTKRALQYLSDSVQTEISEIPSPPDSPIIQVF